MLYAFNVLNIAVAALNPKVEEAVSFRIAFFPNCTTYERKTKQSFPVFRVILKFVNTLWLNAPNPNVK